jgi:hypothetical protein
MSRRSSRTHSSENAVPPAPAGRVCDAPGCVTVLSQYNRNTQCAVHHQYEQDAGRLRQTSNN